MAGSNVQPGVYEHYKSSPEKPRRYEVAGLALHSETKEMLVLYKPLYDCPDLKDSVGLRPYFVRPFSMFVENIQHEGKTMPRFKYIGPEI